MSRRCRPDEGAGGIEGVFASLWRRAVLVRLGMEHGGIIAYSVAEGNEEPPGSGGLKGVDRHD